MRAVTALITIQTLVLFHPFAAAATSVPGGLPFHLTAQGGIVVSVVLNGQGPFPFLLDTGSNGTVIAETLANDLGLHPVARTTLASAIGQRTRAVVRIEHLEIGVLTSEVLASVALAQDLRLPDRDADGRPVAGVIGQDVLSVRPYTIDYRSRRIVWRADDQQPGGVVLALEWLDGRFVAVLPQEHSTIRLVPDTGAQALVLFGREWRDDPGLTFEPGGAGVVGLAGGAAARRARVGSLRIGPTTLTNVPAVVVDNHVNAAADGLLPLHLFARVTVNGPEGKLVIEAR